jgi:riboflavin synthase
MFTGIIESLGTVVAVEQEGSNVHFTLRAPFTSELKVDQSVAHNGVCLTVVKIKGEEYTVTAIAETLERSNLKYWKVGQAVNLERCMSLGARLDGHLVQGHVDLTATCTQRKDLDGSWEFHFSYTPDLQHVTVPKGSITVNGVSLTVVHSDVDHFSVAIIPYTFEHTNFHTLNVGDTVNLEFDVIGKYVARYLSILQPQQTA